MSEPLVPEIMLHQSAVRGREYIPKVIATKSMLVYEGLQDYTDGTCPIIKFPSSEQTPDLYESKGYTCIQPMKARDYDPDKHTEWWDDAQVAVQVKHDGVRTTMHIRNHVNRIFSGRIVKNGWVGENTDRLPHLRDLDLHPFRGTVLDGEIISPVGSTLADFKKVSGTLNCNPDKAVQRQIEEGFFLFAVFDVIYYKGFYVGNLSYAIRYKLLMNVLYRKKGELRSPYIVPCYTVGDNPVILNGKKMDKRDFYHYLFELGVEGVMLKRTNALKYQDNAYKSFDQLKLKQVITLDMVAIGFTEAEEGKTGQFKGLIGAVQLGVYIRADEYDPTVHGDEVREYTHLNGKTYKLEYHKTRVLVNFGKASGMDVPTRRDMTEHPEKYLNQVLKVKCNDIYKDTFVPRNPRYVALHESKNPKQCTFESHKEQAQALPMI